jgi:hypothetical protein
MSEQSVVGKVEELMKILDQVKRYKALARLLVDFLIIVLLSFAVLCAIELSVNLYHFIYGSSFYYIPLNPLVTVPSAAPGAIDQFLALLILGVPALGIISGFVWVSWKLGKVKQETWRSTLDEGFPGALKLLQSTEWDAVFDDIRSSKIAYALYFVAKIIGYWGLAYLILYYPYVYISMTIHSANFYFFYFILLALVLVLNKKDIQKKYRQITSLDALLWELRWFNSEFKSAEFQT